MDLTRWRTPGENLPSNMVKSQKGFWPPQGPCTGLSLLDGNFIKPVLKFFRPHGFSPTSGLWWSRPAVTTAGRGDDSQHNTQAVKEYKGTLAYFGVYLLPSVACAGKRDVTCEEWGCCIHRRRQTGAVKCWREKRNRSTTPLSTSKGQKLRSLKTNQEQVGRNYCQIFSGQWTAKELPKNKAASLKALRKRLVDRKSQESLGDATFMAFSFWQLTVS